MAKSKKSSEKKKERSQEEDEIETTHTASKEGSTSVLLYAAVVQGIIIGALVGIFLLYIHQSSLPLPVAAGAAQCPSCPTCSLAECPDTRSSVVCEAKPEQNLNCQACPVPEGYTYVTSETELMARHPDIETFSNPRVLPVENVFSKSECEWIIQNMLQFKPHTGEVTNLSTTTNQNNATISVESRRAAVRAMPRLDEKFAWVYQKIMNQVFSTNKAHWKFRIPTNFNSQLMEDIQFLEYDGDSEGKGHYNWHSDVGIKGRTAKRLLSGILQLSPETDYTGGDFLMQVTSHAFPLNKAQGDLILFPSYVLHKVSQVTSGKRYSLAVWFQTY